MRIIIDTRLLNEYDGKPATQQGSALSNFLTSPGNTGLGDKQAQLDYGFPYLFGGLVTSNNQAGLFLLLAPQLMNRASAQTLNPAPPKERISFQMAQSNIPQPAQNGQTNPHYKFTSILAEWIGLNEAIVIQHLQTLLAESNQLVSAGGRQWILKTLDDFQVDFPFWDRGIIKRTLRNLKQDGLVSSRYDLNYATGSRSSWHTINYENLSLLGGPVDRLKTKATKRRQARDSRAFDHRPGFVYVCKTPNKSGYKIGLSADTDARMKGLGRATLLHLIPTNDMIQTEQKLHHRFNDKRLDGEYFDLTDRDIQEILSMN